MFPTLFLCIVFIFVWLTGIGIIRWIRFVRWLVWQWWVWIRVCWYVCFYVSLWRICWLCWKICWSCQCCGFGNFCPNINWVNWWRFSVGCVRTKSSQVQRWETHRNILAPKILTFPPILKTSFVAIFLFWTRPAHSNRCNFTIIWPGTYQLDSIVGLPNLVARVPKDLISSDALTATRPKCLKSGTLVPKELLMKSTLHRE